MNGEPAPTLRVDKWLWHARFFKSRTLAGKFVATGKMRINGTPVAKAHALVRPGDVLTFPLGDHIKVARIEALGTRRGPASEARTLYEDLSPPPPPRAEPAATAAAAKRAPGAGRPTKKERRDTERWKNGG